MTIRRMEAGDHDELIALWSSFPGNTTTGADSRDDFERFLEANRGLCLVAEKGGVLAGSVMAGSDTRRGYVYHLAVSGEHQRAGVGSLLMEAVQAALLASGIEKIHLFIYRDNPAAAFYEKLGWSVRQDINVMSMVLIGDPGTGTREGGLVTDDGGAESEKR